MKAVVMTQYGNPDGLQYREDILKPTPKPNQILIRIHATTVTAGDCEIRTLAMSPFLNVAIRIYIGILHPRDAILGQEVAGEVVEVGADVTRFKVGDRVFAQTGFQFGGAAEYIALAEDSLVTHTPEHISHDEAAGFSTGGLEAVRYINLVQIQSGQRVLINGAGGSIGTFVLQIFKSKGAQVTVVDYGDKLPMLQSIGADATWDYRDGHFYDQPEKYDF